MTVTPWLFDLEPDDEELAGLAGSLDAEERRRAAAFRHDLHRRRFVARRGQLRRLLATLTGERAEAIRLESSIHGKPRLCGGGDLRFSTSSAGGLGLCVVAQGVELGCDLAVDESVPSDLAVARRLFTPREQAALAALPDGARRHAFLEIWTRKEACLKAVGTGFQCSPASFCVADRSAESVGVRVAGRALLLGPLAVGAGHVAALAVKGAGDWPRVLPARTFGHTPVDDVDVARAPVRPAPGLRAMG